MPHVDWLMALNRVSPHIYAGSVPGDVVKHRRARNKRARAARRAAKRRSHR